MKRITKLIGSLICCCPIISPTIVFNQNNVLLKQNNLTSKQTYDILQFINSVTIEVTAVSATNVFINGDPENPSNGFKIYADGSFELNIYGQESGTILKTVTFADYQPIEIAANQYLQEIEDKNWITTVDLGTVNGAITTTISGEMHVVTLFNNEIQIFSNDGVEETTWLSKVPSLQAIGDDTVHRVFFTKGDFWFTWPEQKEMKTMSLYQADDKYQKTGSALYTITDFTTNETPKTIISKTETGETHYILEIENTVENVQQCLICAQNLNLRIPQNPFTNFWYSFNGATNPIVDQDGGELWAKLRYNKPDFYTDDYLKEFDDIIINKLILISSNWKIPEIKATDLAIVDGYSTSITTTSGYGKKIENPIMVQTTPIGATVDYKYDIYYHDTLKLAPNFIYVDRGGYLSIKDNTYEVFPQGQDFDVVVTDLKSGVSTSNKATINVIVTGTPTPKIKSIEIDNPLPSTLKVDPRDGYINTTPIQATVISEDPTQEIPQDVHFSLECDGSDELPEWISIDNEGFIKIEQNDQIKNIKKSFRIVATSTYNDAYFAKTGWFDIWLTTRNITPSNNFVLLILILIITGLVLITFGGFFWLYDKKKKTKLTSADKIFKENFKVSDKELTEIKTQKVNLDGTDKVPKKRKEKKIND